MFSRITVSNIENAFLPAKEIDSAERFSGRKTAIEDCYYALLSNGTNIAIVGNRGIGKSSLARQVANMAQGNNEILKKLDLPHKERLDYLTVYFACGKSINNYQALLETLLTLKDCLMDWIYDIPNAYKEVVKVTPKLNLGIASIEGDTSIETSKEAAIINHSIDVIFQNVLSEMIKSKIAKNGILIVIDEFDQISEPAGFASFLKSMATNVPGVKFCIVGVAQDIQNLLKEHESTDRLFAGSIVILPPMSNPELTEIIRSAEKSIKNTINFDSEATTKLVSLAQGHPYMVHLIGKYALRAAFSSNKSTILSGDIDSTLKDIAARNADPVLEGRYKKAVAASPQREIVLKALAQTQGQDGEIFTGNAYKIALDLGVDNASQYVGHLVTEEYGAEIVKIRERYYRFRDSLFNAYVRAHPYYFS